MNHEHHWWVTLRPGRWNARCRCGLAVAVEMLGLGNERWTWTLAGKPPDAETMSAGSRSIARAMGEYITKSLLDRRN